MIEPGEPAEEHIRLATLRAMGLLDTPPEERFDRITRLASRLFDAPISLISLVDVDRQWFKSNVGLGVSETARNISFCAHAVADGDSLIVPDTHLDIRFADNPLVVHDPSIRFYAGHPISAPDGHHLGTLCVIDRRARDFSPEDVGSLHDLAAMVEDEIARTHLAISDELTGLANRRGFEQLGDHVLKVCDRLGGSATVIVADLDGLKPVNDRFGHQAGDQAIRCVAEHLAEVFRDSDVVARIGGDEFAVVLTGTVVDAQPALQRFRTELSRCTDSDVTVSVGCAEFRPDRPRSLPALVREADAAMYQAKRSRLSEPTR